MFLVGHWFLNFNNGYLIQSDMVINAQWHTYAVSYTQYANTVVVPVGDGTNPGVHVAVQDLTGFSWGNSAGWNGMFISVGI